MDLICGFIHLKPFSRISTKTTLLLNQRAKQCIKCLKLKECEYSYAYIAYISGLSLVFELQSISVINRGIYTYLM